MIKGKSYFVRNPRQKVIHGGQAALFAELIIKRQESFSQKYRSPLGVSGIDEIKTVTFETR
jgi:hypothetical protein